MQPIRVLSSTLDILTEIDDYESLTWTRRFHRPGEFELHININKKDTDKLEKENIVLFGKKAGIIRHREISINEEGKGGETLKVVGSSLSSLVGRRITIPPQGQAYDVISGNAETVIKHYVDKNCVNPADAKRKIPNLIIAPNRNRGGSIKYQSRLKQLDEELEKIAVSSGLGWDIDIDTENKTFVFDVMEGRNLTAGQAINSPVIFSIDFDNIKGQKYIDSDLNYRNQAYVGGQGEGVERSIVEVGNNLQGLDRHEVFIDARDIENAADLPSRGQQKLAELAQLKSFESEILTRGPFEYEKDWDLGDIVTVVNPKWNITLDSRIIEVKEIFEPSGFKLEATFGNTIPTLIDKIKQEIDMPLVETGGAGVSSWEDIPDKPTEYPPSGHKHKTSDITDFPTSLPANGGNADTVGGKYPSDFVPMYKHDFWVDGDADTYYPVVVKDVVGSHFFGGQLIYIYRGYSETAPPWNTETHKGGLDIKVECFLKGWGGQRYYMDILFGQTYTRVVANIEMARPDTCVLIFWLRGGHAIYHAQTTAPNVTITPYIGDYKHKEGTQYEVVYSPRTTVESVFDTYGRRRISCGFDEYYTTSDRYPKNAVPKY